MLLVLCALGVAPTALAAVGFPAIGAEEPILSADPHTDVLTSTSSSAVLHRESAGPDTFALYGGPARGKEGKFETTTGLPDWQGWRGVDLTERVSHWQVSTFNAENLGGHGTGNRAYWCGLAASEASSWVTPPGYGNRWDVSLLFESAPVADTNTGQIVSLDFFFNHDLEPGYYDAFIVEYDSAGRWVNVLRIDGTNKVAESFPAPGVSLQSVATRPITYVGGDYSADGTIRIRLRVATDSAFSDEDGLWPTDGAVQIDDVTITTSEATHFEDFEGPAPHLLRPLRPPFFGDFAEVHALLTDLDPCVDDRSAVLAFIDHGQDVPNGPGHDGRTSTGGSLPFPNRWGAPYGLPGGWVVNYTNGLASTAPAGIGVTPQNEAWSPEIGWDLPGPEDDGSECVGAKLRYSAYMHNPVLNGIFRVWAVRSRSTDGVWSPWKSRGVLHFSEIPRWENNVHDVTDLLVSQPTHVQISHGIIDASRIFDLPGIDATPAPYIDNVAFYKYRVGGLALTTRPVDLANDSFPQSGMIDASTLAARDALDVRFDMARDINSNTRILTAGDSLIVDVKAILPGTSVAGLRMKWALRVNPVFDDVRSVPSRPVDENVDASGPVWTGEVVASASTNRTGSVVVGRYFFDLPDADLLHPGDRLHYYVEATDDAGRVTTLPDDLRGFGTWDALGRSLYDRVWTMHCLPSILDADGTQPSKLIYIEETRVRENELLLVMGQLGLVEGIDFDVYVVQGASSGVSNGIGSAGGHGATSTQLAGYDTIVVTWESLTTFLLSNGVGVSRQDKGDDIGTLTGWKNLAGQRNTVYFGDHAVSGQSSPEGWTYLRTIMGTQLDDNDVRDEIGGQTAPLVRGLLPAFASEFAAYGGCPAINQFDSIVALPGAVAGHAWVGSSGANYATPAASVVFDRIVSGQRKVDITFPFGFGSVYGAAGNGLPLRARLLGEIFDYLGVASSGTEITSAPRRLDLELSIAPNPFNPRTEIRFRAQADARVRIVAHDLRGRRVGVLFDGKADGSEQRVVWDAAARASGVYLVRIEAHGRTLTQKVALVR